MPVEGLEIPDWAAGGRGPHVEILTIFLEWRSRKQNFGERRASASNFFASAAVYPSPRIRKSTRFSGSPVF